MPGPRAGFSGVIVRVRNDDYGLEVERLGSEVPSALVHRACQQGSDCKGSGCRVQTGKTNGQLVEVRAWRQRSAEMIARRERTTRDAVTVISRAA